VAVLEPCTTFPWTKLTKGTPEASVAKRIISTKMNISILSVNGFHFICISRVKMTYTHTYLRNKKNWYTQRHRDSSIQYLEREREREREITTCAKSEMKLVTQIVASTYPVIPPRTHTRVKRKLDIWHLWFLEVSKLASRISCLQHLFIIWYDEKVYYILFYMQ